MKTKSVVSEVVAHTLERIAALLGIDPAASLLDTYTSFEGRDMWRPTFDWVDAVNAAAMARRNHPVYDTVLIGAGPLSQHVMHSLRRRSPNVVMIAINDCPGSRTYAQTGRAFALNTGTMRPDVRHPLPRVALADLCNERFVPGLVLSDAMRCNALLDELPIWNFARVEALTRVSGGWTLGVRYRGRMTELRARRVVIATGFGVPSLSGLAQDLHEEAQRSPSQSAVLPKVYSAEGLMDHAGWGSFAHERLTGHTSIVGSGPSALAVLSLLFGLAPRTMPSNQSFEEVRRVTWYLGSRTSPPFVTPSPSASGIDRELEERYASLAKKIAQERQSGRLEVLGETRAGLATREGGTIAIGGVASDSVVDCTGYRPFQFASLGPEMGAARFAVRGDVAEIPACYVVGDCVLPLLREDFSKGPLEQWADGAADLGERLAADVRRASVLEDEMMSADYSTQTFEPAPIGCDAPSAERAGVTIALQSVAAACNVQYSEPHIACGKLVVNGLEAAMAQALNARHISILTQRTET